MNYNFLKKWYLIPLVFISLLTVSCDDDDDIDLPGLDDTTFTVTIDNVVTPQSLFQSDVFAIPVGGSEPAPLFPGDAYEFTVIAGPNITPGDAGTRLSFMTMMVQSNDLFYAPSPEGIPLYEDNGDPIGRSSMMDVTDQILLWDAGTEVNVETGGASQKPQQDPMAEDVGTDENGVVTQIMNNTDGLNTLPAVDEVIKVTITNTADAEFLVRIENVSDMMTIMTMNGTAPVPMSPGVWAVHTAPSPFFTTGEAASEGVENIAEDGFPEVAAMTAAANTGLIVPLSPGAYAVHEDGSTPLYELGEADFGEGLEAIAEDGIPTDLAAALGSKDDIEASGLFNTAVGASDPGAIGPGGSYQFTFEAEEGDRLSLATMYVQSNDWFYAFPPEGIALFNGDTPISGDITNALFLYDAGTETDEFPGAGLNQVIRQGSADTGPADADNSVRLVQNAPAIVAPTEQIIRVTISAQ